MPRYDFECARCGKKREVRYTYPEFDKFKSGGRIQVCGCSWEMEVKVAATPKVFAINDQDFAFSLKKFDIGQNRSEI